MEATKKYELIDTPTYLSPPVGSIEATKKYELIDDSASNNSRPAFTTNKTKDQEAQARSYAVLCL
jgi:hypothetical protein